MVHDSLIMKNNRIPFTEIPSIPQQIKDLLNGGLTDFTENVFSKDNFELKIKEKSLSYEEEKRAVLHQVLSSQLSNFTLTDKQKDNLNKLKNKSTFTITTGHQLNLFTGSAFFIYKILQTIKTAEELKNQFPNYDFVPLFWMATEDHDFEEIQFFRTAGKKYQWEAKSGGAVGRIKLENLDFINQFEEDFKCLPYGEELIQLLKSAYQNGKTLTQATQEIVHYLFSDRGLLFIDGDERLLKKQMIEVYKKELFDFCLFNESEVKRQFLEDKYGKVQVNPREINLFYLSDTRDRIIKQGNVWKVLDKQIQWEEKQLLEELQNYPQRFSPNAVLRPAFQETVLPNLAYIGGNAEIMYWFELKDYFEKINLPYPILIPRNSMLFLKSKTIRKVEKLGFQLIDFFDNLRIIINDKLLDDNEILSLLNSQEEKLNIQFNELKEKSADVDVTFRNLVEAEQTRQLKSFQRMKKRLIKAQRIKHHEYLERVEKVKEEIHPLGTWQERIFNFSQFYSVYGKSWIDSCYKLINVENLELNIIEI